MGIEDRIVITEAFITRTQLAKGLQDPWEVIKMEAIRYHNEKIAREIRRAVSIQGEAGLIGVSHFLPTAAKPYMDVQSMRLMSELVTYRSVLKFDGFTQNPQTLLDVSEALSF